MLKTKKMPIDDKLVCLIRNVIEEILKLNLPADKILSNCFKYNKNLGSYKKYIIAETSYSVLRNYNKLTAVSSEIFELIGLTWIHLLSLPPEDYTLVHLINFKRLSSLSLPETNADNLEMPQWVLKQMAAQYSQSELLPLVVAFQKPAPLDLRVNLLKNNVVSVINQFKNDGFFPKPTELSAFGLRFENKIPLAKHPLFLGGSIEVQDESSQLAGLLLNPKRGDMVVDFCAGSGGKTLLLGMLMKNTGRIYAFDVNQRRLNNLTPRLARSGLTNVHPQLIAHENDTKIKRLHNKIDRVFVDAPCSGLGTLRRNPDLRFRQTDAGLEELNQKQLSILTAASKLLKVGGYMVYATCSILPAENQNIVTQFLASHPNFKHIPATQVLKNDHLCDANGNLVLLPHIHGTDGFFACLLQKTS